MDLAVVDQVSLNFSRSVLISLYAVMGLMMYGMALGMILIAACPNGNLSNVLTFIAHGNTAL